jgi:transcriptional regulator with XRE-family HTH domain
MVVLPKPSNRTSPSSDVPAAIIAIRKRLGLNQIDFAKLLNARQKMISQYENGRVKPSAPQIIKLLSLTGNQPGAHQSESLPLIGFLAEQLGLSEAAVMTVMGVETGVDLLAAMAAERKALCAMGAELEARRQALDEERKQLHKEEQRILMTVRSWRKLPAADQDRADNSGGGERE